MYSDELFIENILSISDLKPDNLSSLCNQLYLCPPGDATRANIAEVLFSEARDVSAAIFCVMVTLLLT